MTSGSVREKGETLGDMALWENERAEKMEGGSRGTGNQPEPLKWQGKRVVGQEICLGQGSLGTERGGGQRKTHHSRGSGEG